jgi:hypothetical protein
MVIVQLAGGLGNQMFQYAAGRRLAYVRGVPLKLDVFGYGPKGDTQAPGLEAFRRQVRIGEFNLASAAATPEEVASLRDLHFGSSTRSRIVRRLRKVWPKLAWPATHFRERQYRFDPQVLDLAAPCYLSGFWQSEKYFADTADLIRHDFTPRDPAITDYTRRYLGGLRGDAKAIVSVHVRRGELAYARDVLKSTKGVFGPPTGVEYIQQAIRRFDPNCKFLVFSDSATDIVWCKKNITADRLHFSEGHSDIQDMMLMSSCDHNIVASTFSWWAAWLNPRPERRVIAPSQWGHPGGEMVTDDLIPSAWEMI